MLLGDNKLDKGSVDNDRRNVISWACAGGHLDTLRLLLKYGCPGVDDRDVDGWAPLAWAIHRDSPETVETLISSRSVDVEQADGGGRSVLSWAVEYGHIEVVRTLLQAGADPHSEAQKGISPISVAKNFGRDDIVKELLAYMKKGPGSTPLVLGRTKGGPSTKVE